MVDNGNSFESSWHDLRPDADEGREPDFVTSNYGRRLVSVQALLEKIEREFVAEYNDTTILSEADTASKRLKLLLSTVNYVLAVESVQVSDNEKANIIRTAYSNIFGYGPLDVLLMDERITTIVLDGADKASVRYGHGDLVAVGPLFEDMGHLRRILRRLLIDAGVKLSEDQPFIETGLMVEHRRICINLTSPPVAVHFHVDMRLHPSEPPTADSLVEKGFLSEQSISLLTALAKSPYGLVVVGDTESGKTTLLSLLASMLPRTETVIAVERAGEMHLPDAVKRLMARWASDSEPGVTFGDQIGIALNQKPRCILLDEVRADEPEAIAPLLQRADMPRQLWSFRGPFDAKRLRNALGMLARRADASQGEALVYEMFNRLPFVITVWRAKGRIGLYSVGEWQFRNDEYPDYVALMAVQDGRLSVTGERPTRTLDVSDGFWNVQT